MYHPLFDKLVKSERQTWHESKNITYLNHLNHCCTPTPTPSPTPWNPSVLLFGWQVLRTFWHASLLSQVSLVALSVPLCSHFLDAVGFPPWETSPPASLIQSLQPPPSMPQGPWLFGVLWQRLVSSEIWKKLKHEKLNAGELTKLLKELRKTATLAKN